MSICLSLSDFFSESNLYFYQPNQYELNVSFSLCRLLCFFLMLQLGGGYLFGLPVGFVADSIGATIGATAAFLLGRTVSLTHRLFLICRVQ